MKIKIYSTIIALLLCLSMYAQAPQKFSYQAVVYNASNQLVVNASVSLKIAICKGSPESAPVYVETHKSTTNANGLVTIEIGSGTVVVAGNRVAFSAVDWSSGTYYIRTKIDPTGGVNYDLITLNTQLLSVPYALYAEKSGTGIKGDKGDQGIQGVKGDKGDTGVVGPKGDAGSKIISGAGSPIGSRVGSTGDYFLDTVAKKLYGPRTTSGWLEIMNFETPKGNSVSILSMDSLKNNSVFITAEIISNKGANVTARGFCWSTSPNPVVADTNTSKNGSGKGVFSTSIKGLKDSTTYYIRPYLTSGIGTVYGSEMSFKTNNFHLRSKGQAGGIIFYDKGFYSDGWRFMEISPEDLPRASWGGAFPTPLKVKSTDINNLELSLEKMYIRDIGRGKSNTMAIVDSALVHNRGVVAATECFDFSLNGFDDWYLPSAGEAEQIRLNLMQANQNNPAKLLISAITPFYYLTSSSLMAPSIMGYTERNLRTRDASSLLGVRAVRYF